MTLTPTQVNRLREAQHALDRAHSAEHLAASDEHPLDRIANAQREIVRLCSEYDLDARAYLLDADLPRC